MNTAEVFEVITRLTPADASFVCSLGRTSDEAFDRVSTRCLFIDSMGDIIPIASGIALGTEGKRVVALDTDGSHLMGLACLPVVGALKGRLSNLLIIVFDNQMYESAGRIPSRHCLLDWPTLGRAFGISIAVASTPEELESALADAFTILTFIVAQIANEDPAPTARKTVDGIESRYLFIRHLETITGREILRPAVKS